MQKIKEAASEFLAGRRIATYPSLRAIPGGVDGVVIDGGCPCMFGPTADPGHKLMRGLLKLAGNVPRRV